MFRSFPIRVDVGETNFFDCATPATETISKTSDTGLGYWSCTSTPQHGLGNHFSTGTPVYPPYYPGPGTLSRSTENNDNIAYGYVPPQIVPGPNKPVVEPPWGAFNISEEDATLACNTGLISSAVYPVCEPFYTDGDINSYMYACKADIKVTKCLILCIKYRLW